MTKQRRSYAKPSSSSKAGWYTVGDRKFYFRSGWEVNYALYLQWLLEKGQIQAWDYECEVFWFGGIKRGVVSYLPDFKVTENSGKEVFHEVKGYMDSRSKTKIKRMAKYHPKIRLIVIDAKAYRALATQVKRLIPGWK